jgi:type II secretory pathway pseudopilin PulG
VRGYTLIEVMVVAGIFIILTGLISINFIRPQTRANVDSTVAALMSDLRNQQTRAMIGDATNQLSAQSYGIHFEGITYTLFQGTTYTAGAANNVVVRLQNLTVTSNLPNNQIIFSRMSGDVTGYSSSQNTMTVSSGGEQKVISVNQYGTPTIQ